VGVTRIVIHVGGIAIRNARPRVERFAAEFSAELTRLLALPGNAGRLAERRGAPRLSTLLPHPMPAGSRQSIGVQTAAAIARELLK